MDQRSKNDPEPPSPFDVSDPDFQREPHYSKWCGRGSIIILKPTLGKVIVTPLRCGSWVCPHCGPLKRDELVKRLKSAHANRFLTLTCAHPEGTTPFQAEAAIRAGWTAFIAALRMFAPKLEYFRTMEWQENGWPHLHVLLRCHFIPKKTIADAWHLHCWPGFINIKKIVNDAGIPYELTKYIAKAYLVAQRLDKHQRLFSSSQKFFPPKPEQSLEDYDPEATWYITSDTPDDVYNDLKHLPFLQVEAPTLRDELIFTQCWPEWKGWAAEVDALCKALPWFTPLNHGECHGPPF